MHEANQKVSIMIQEEQKYNPQLPFQTIKKLNQIAQPKETGVCGWLVASLDMVMLVFIVYCDVCDTTRCCVLFKC